MNEERPKPENAGDTESSGGITVSRSESGAEIQIAVPPASKAGEIETFLKDFLSEPMTSLEKRVSKTIDGFKKKAEGGDKEALSILLYIACCSTTALSGIENREALKRLAETCSVWPVISSSARSAHEANKKFFQAIGLGDYRTNIDAAKLIKRQTPELHLAVHIFEEINQMRRGFQIYDQMLNDPSLSPELAKMRPNYLFSAKQIPLSPELQRRTASLPEFYADKASREAWGAVALELFSILTGGEPEREEILYGPPRFSADEIKDLPILVNRLRLQADPFSAFLWRRMSKADQSVLSAWRPSTPIPSQCQGVVVQFLNDIISGPGIYRPDLFQTERLRNETIELLHENPNGQLLVHLNRFLLEDAFPEELSKTLLYKSYYPAAKRWVKRRLEANKPGTPPIGSEVKESRIKNRIRVKIYEKFKVAFGRVAASAPPPK
jgi:hypothetical protein